MSTIPSTPVSPEIDYPVSDGQPMAETPIHRRNMTNTIASLERWYREEPEVYISGNMFVYYVEGQRNRHLSPDTFVVLGVPRRERDCYKTWEEPKHNLDFVAEFTSRSTREEDVEDKFRLYRDELRVREYLMFDPYEEYLDPPEQLYRLHGGAYRSVKPVDGRLPSRILGLHLERQGHYLRLYDPESGLWLLTPDEIADQRDERTAERDEALAELAQRDAEIARLQHELKKVKRDGKKKS